MTVKLLTEHHLEFVRLTGRCTGSSESTQSCQNATVLEITCHGSFLSKSTIFNRIINKNANKATMNSMKLVILFMRI